MTENAPVIQAFFHAATHSVAYLVCDLQAGQAAVIDPVLDYDPRCGRISTEFADCILAAAHAAGSCVAWSLETHAHADHLSAAHYIKRKTGARTAIGAHIDRLQQTFSTLFNAPDVSGSGAEFDVLFQDGEKFVVGEFAAEVWCTPGHTPCCVSYRIADAIFVGDTLFMPDSGTARADFPGADAHALYRSIRRILSLPAETRIFVCHDYKAPGREEFAWETTVAEQRTYNIHIADGIGEDAFVALRKARDATLAVPALMYPAVQVNIRAGRLPPAEANGRHYLKMPVELGDEGE
jgi:glyoxylase-like metal-dependent hydrolase (beta-lactamase superfamily II)